MIRPPELGPRIQYYREAAGMSKAELARRACVSDVSIGFWESGAVQTINSRNLLKLAVVLGITVSELVGDPQLPGLKARWYCELAGQGPTIHRDWLLDEAARLQRLTQDT